MDLLSKLFAKISLLKLGVIQSQAGLHKEQMMREELVKDDAQFGEDLEESENKIEIVNRNSNRTDNTRDYFDHQYEIEESNSRKSFVEEKLESIFEDEKEKAYTPNLPKMSKTKPSTQ